MDDNQSFSLVVGAAVLIALVTAIIVIIVVVSIIIQHQRLQHPLQNEELALTNDKTTDGIGFDYMEDVLNVINFRSATSGPTIIIEPQLPSRNDNTTSLEADSEPSQSVLPSETEIDLEQIDDTNKYMDQDCTQNLSDDSCIGSSTSPLGSYSFDPSPDCACAAYETNDRHNKSCMVYTRMSGYNVLSPLIANGKVVGPTPVEDQSERFEYENGRIDSYEGNEEICVPDFKTLSSCQENDTPLPDQYECSTQSGSPVVSAMPLSSKYSVLICTATTNRKKEHSDSSSTREHQKSHSKANVSDLLCGSFSADEKMPSSTEVIHEGGLSSNEVVLEKTVDSKETDEEADGKAARGGIKQNEQAMMPAISPHQNDNNEDSTHR